jgi:hypothetical protein
MGQEMPGADQGDDTGILAGARGFGSCSAHEPWGPCQIGV